MEQQKNELESLKEQLEDKEATIFENAEILANDQQDVKKWKGKIFAFNGALNCDSARMSNRAPL